MTLTFERNWTHLCIRHTYRAEGILTKEATEQFPLSPNFIKWAKPKMTWIEKKLNSDPRLGITHEPFSEGDYTNNALRMQMKQEQPGSKWTRTATGKWKQEVGTGICSQKWIIRDKRLTSVPIEPYEVKGVSIYPNKYLLNAFPVSSELETKLNCDMEKLTRTIDRRLNDWNPRVRETADAEIGMLERDYDEFGNPLHAEYTVEPEIIGEVPSMAEVLGIDNPQFVGLNEYDEEVYSDFDPDGIHQPMGNPDNSSDTRDDLDLTDHTNYREQDWQSMDFADDHHVDISFREQAITETPVFDKNHELVDWTTETHSDIEDPVSAGDDEDWIADARNWMTRENLLQSTEDQTIRDNIIDAYPVSHRFIEYLEENEIDWEVANQRLQLITKDRDSVIKESAKVFEPAPYQEAIDLNTGEVIWV